MDGITILNTIETTIYPDYYYVIIALCVIGIVAGLIMAGVSLGDLFNAKSLIAGIAIIVISFVIASLSYRWVTHNDVYTIRRYECTIDDLSSFIYIHNNYNVIEQRGGIWILEDK